jgi:AcrR family transcriptional regulator
MSERCGAGGAQEGGEPLVSQSPTARRALLDAFAELALSRRYHEFGVGLIARQANVARSTFYYHFRSKDELLLQNLAPMFAALSRLAVADAPVPEITDWTAHIWEHRGRATRMFGGATGRKIAAALAAEVRRDLQETAGDPAAIRLAPLLADQIASGMLGLLQSWTSGRAAASPAEIAQLLWLGARTAAASASALPGD